ncbi:hypothetical protein LWI29_012664, partial [Acer saccharum]
MSKIFYFHVKKVGQTPTGLTKRQRGKGAKKDKKSLQKVRICRYKGYQNENVPCYKPKTHHQNPKSLTYIVSVVAFVYVREQQEPRLPSLSLKMKMLISLRYLMRRTVASRRESVRNPTSFIRGQLMHTDTAAGDTNLSLRTNILGLYVGTDHVGLSVCDSVSNACIGLWSSLNRKEKDIFTLAKELKKFIEELEVGLLVVACPWNTEESDHTEKVAKKRMEEHGIAGLVMSPEERAENHFNDEVAMVERFIQDLSKTGMLTGLKCMYCTARIFVNPLNMKRKIQELKLARYSGILFKDETELEEVFLVMYASEFMLMHFVKNFVQELEGSECTLKRRNVSVLVEVEYAPNAYRF